MCLLLFLFPFPVYLFSYVNTLVNILYGMKNTEQKIEKGLRKRKENNCLEIYVHFYAFVSSYHFAYIVSLFKHENSLDNYWISELLSLDDLFFEEMNGIFVLNYLITKDTKLMSRLRGEQIPFDFKNLLKTWAQIIYIKKVLSQDPYSHLSLHLSICSMTPLAISTNTKNIPLLQVPKWLKIIKVNNMVKGLCYLEQISNRTSTNNWFLQRNKRSSQLCKIRRKTSVSNFPQYLHVLATDSNEE